MKVLATPHQDEVKLHREYFPNREQAESKLSNAMVSISTSLPIRDNCTKSSVGEHLKRIARLGNMVVAAKSNIAKMGHVIEVKEHHLLCPYIFRIGIRVASDKQYSPFTASKNPKTEVLVVPYIHRHLIPREHSTIYSADPESFLHLIFSSASQRANATQTFSRGCSGCSVADK